VTAEDTTALHQLWIDEQVRRYLWDAEIIPLTQTREIVDKSNRLFRDDGFGIWGVCESNSADLIGFAGYWHFRSQQNLELLFGVGPSHWNRGIATECARLLIGYGFDTLGLSTVEASTDKDNTASIRVLEKSGMRLQRIERVNGSDTVFFSIAQFKGQKLS
jgi:ribosomal-protein-alanine N-acetyltransferase